MRSPLCIDSLLSAIIARSPHCRRLAICSGFARELIDALLPTQGFHRVTHLTFNADWERQYYSTFFRDLLTIFPNLPSLQYPCGRQWMSAHATTLDEAIEHLRKDFPKLTRFILLVQWSRIPRRNFFDIYKLYLLEK